MVATNFVLPFGGIVLLVCQICEHSCFQNKFFNRFGFNLGSKSMLFMRKIIKYSGW